MAFKRILCAVDFSRESLEAFRVAIETARLHSASLHIFHVIEAQPVLSEWLPINGMSEVTTKIVEKASATMEALIASVQSSLDGLSFTTEVTSGRAFVEIVNRAREWNADLIVLGAKGAALLEKIVVGSTAERVLKEADCSVLVVRSRISP
jgi:universal stress protein A